MGSNSITDEVFNKVINQSNDKRVIGISIELKSLFNNIINGDKIMADKDISDFLKIMNDQQKRQDLEKLVDAYNCLPALMREHYKIYLEEQREKLPKLEKIGQHKDICLYVDFKYKKKTYYIDFWFYHNQISIYLGARDYDKWKKQLNALKKDMTSDWLFGDIPTDDLPMIIFSDVYNEKEVIKRIALVDKYRQSYYKHFTGNNLENAGNYDLCINTGSNTVEELTDIVKYYVKSRTEKK